MDNRKFITVNGDTVLLIHNMPFDRENGLGKTEAELLEIGYLVDDIPEPNVPEGKLARYHYTPENGFWFTYEDAPVDPETERDQKIANLEAQLETTQELLDNIIMGNIELA